MLRLAALLGVAALSVDAKVFMSETFDEGWRDRWTVPTQWKSESELGEWGWTAGEYYPTTEDDKGIQTSQDARFYGLSAPLTETFSNEGKDLVIGYTVKHEQRIDCGGAYIKLLGDMDQDSFGGPTPYQIMFGPDICGTSSSERRTHLIFYYPPKDDNLLVKENIRVESDVYTHVYMLHIKPDNTFTVYIDDKSVRDGSLEDSHDFLPDREIPDPEVSKPEDWVDEEMMDDPEDVKPDGWDDIPKEIPDPDAAMPDDWDEDEDGEWEPPLIDNPEYKGEWTPKRIPNPDYKGPWEHPKIPNPDFDEAAAEKLHARCDGCAYVGFELWQVKSGTIFDSIIVSDDLEEARAFLKPKLDGLQAEKDMKKEQDDAKRAKEAEEAEEEEEEEEEDEGDEFHEEL